MTETVTEAFLDCNTFEFSYICGKFPTILTYAMDLGKVPGMAQLCFIIVPLGEA